jgi:hypothetical protein
MRRTVVSLAALFFAAAPFVPSATAASPHFKKGGAPVCTISGTTTQTVSCTGTLAGLGNETVVVDLTVDGFAVYQCQNKGGNIAPGQNKVPFSSSTSDTFSADEIKNGTLTFTTTTSLTAAETVSGRAAGCPNGNWKGVGGTLTLSDITLVISQPPGEDIFTCTASDPTSPPVKLTCS